MLPALPQAPAPRYLAPALTLLLATAITGCVALSTNRIPSTGMDPTMPGVAYCLPKGKITIKVERTDHPAVDAPNPAAAAAPAKPKKDDAKKGVAKGGDTSPTPGLPGNNTPAEPEAEAETPEVPATIKVTPPPTYRISYVSTEYVPDTSKPCYLRYHPNAMYEDSVDIKLTKKGLLDQVDITTDDKTVDIAKKVIEIAKNIARLGAVAQGDGPVTLVYQAAFDPLNPPELYSINQQLRDVPGGPYEVSIVPESYDALDAGKGLAPHAQPTAEDKLDGVAYRPVFSYGVTLKQKPRSGPAVPHEVASVLLPNEADVIYLPVRRSAFVKKVNKLDFDEGILVQATLSKPSEVLGGVEIPLEITRALLALPGEIAGDNVAAYKRNSDVITARTSAETTEATASRNAVLEETKNVEAETNLLKAKKELEAARK